MQAHTKKHVAPFPFFLLSMWIKPFQSENLCSGCKKQAIAFVSEHYMDIHDLMTERDPKKAEQIKNRVWDEALTDQRRGVYSNALTTYHCYNCVFTIIQTWSGESAATLAMLPMTISGRGSVALCSQLQSVEDEGKPCAIMAMTQTIDRLAQQLRSENPLSIRLSR